MNHRLRCNLLGPVEVEIDGSTPPVELMWRKNLGLLIYLVRHPDRVHARDHLMGLLWGEKEDRPARHSLREAIRVLRKCLWPELIVTEGDSVRVVPGEFVTDVAEFDSAVRDSNWIDAAGFVRGQFAEGFVIPGESGYEEWLARERRSLVDVSVTALTKAASLLADGGKLLAARGLCERATELEPASEAAVRIGMKVAALSADRTRALKLYDILQSALEELGTKPTDDTLKLAARIRQERSWPVDTSEAARRTVVRRTPLVGRAAELERLSAVWSEIVAAGHCGVGIVGGESGSGKSRLLEEFGARVRLDGGTVMSLRSVRSDRNTRYSGIVGIARGGLLDAPGLAAASPRALGTFAARLTEWADRFSANESDDDIASALTDALQAVGAEQPVVVLLDDSHWLDHATLETIERMTRDLTVPIYFILAITDGFDREELDGLRSRIGRELTGAVVHTGTLGVSEVRELVRWALPFYGDDEVERLERRLLRDTAGLPLLLVELLCALANGMEIGRYEGAWPTPLRTLEQTMPGELPDSVVGSIRVGFRTLQQPAQDVLAVAAVLDDRVTLGDLQSVLDHLSTTELEGALDESEWKRWMVADGRGYSFVARVVKDVIARDMVTAGKKKRILERHASVAEPSES